MPKGQGGGILVFNPGKVVTERELRDFFAGEQLLGRKVVFDLSEVESTNEPERLAVANICAELFLFHCRVAVCARPMLGYTLLEHLEGYAELFFSPVEAIASLAGHSPFRGAVPD